MGIIRTFIVDDERYAREELSFLLERFPNIEVIQQLDRGEATIYQAISLQPDVIFLDVEMPKMSGIEVAKSLLALKKVPLIVFATAYPQFAAEAFRINAIDYLLKPYCPKQLEQTIDRITYRIHEHTPIQQVNSLGKLAVEQDGEFEYIFVKDILYMYPEGKITKITTLSNEYEVKSSLKELESRLAPFNFFRIHRSYLVNLNYVTKLTPWFNGAYQLKLTSESQTLPVSRNYAKALQKRLDI